MVFNAILAGFLKFGLVGLFVSSFVSSLFFFPAYATFLIPIYLKLGFNPWHILIVITAGSVIGEIVNYYLGFIGSKYIYHKEMKKAEKWLYKWGGMSVFIFNLIPMFPADIIDALVGFLRMDFKMFFIGMSTAKILQYGLLIFGTEIFFRFVSFV